MRNVSVQGAFTRLHLMERKNRDMFGLMPLFYPSFYCRVSKNVPIFHIIKGSPSMQAISDSMKPKGLIIFALLK